VLDVPILDDPAASAAATYLAATLHALVREEQAGRRPRRLLDPGPATWQRFRGRLGARDLAELILEDAAVTQPQAFRAAEILGHEDPFQGVPEPLIEHWLTELAAYDGGRVSQTLNAPPVTTHPNDIEEQARRLGLVARPAFSELSKLQPHHRVLELPGTGGRLAAYVVETQPGIFLKDVFSIACASWQERTLAGLVGVGLGVVGDVRILVDPDLSESRSAPGGFSHLFGLRREKGGRFSADELQGWFPTATVVLV
jgi:hypothetical protein